MPLIWFFLYCRWEYIRLGSEQDPTWRDFLQALTEMGGARHYITLFEAPFQASVLSDSENNALRASSLMAIPSPPHGSQPLAGSTAVDLMGNNLTQWASDVQEVTSYMRWPPEAAVRCPLVDMIGVLNRLEGLARVRYCRSCFGVGPGCQCSAVPRQVSGPTTALWAPPTSSYSAMVSSTETTASTSTAGVTPPSRLPPRDPAVELMDTLPPLTTENLLATAGIGWGHRPQAPPRIATAPGLHQMRPKMPQQQAPTPGRQQVFPPKCPAPKPSTTPSASRDQGGPAGEAGSAQSRSSSRGPQERLGRSRSSTRGSKKCRWADPNDSMMDKMANFVASGWRRDLTHFIGCCWSAQIGSLEWDEWHVAITKFLAVMAKKKNCEWTDIKELTPLQFMPYVAKLFREVTGRDLSGLSHFTGWIGAGGYYHWRVVQQGLVHQVPHLAGQPAPRTPDARPSGKSLPPKPPQTKTPSTGASGQQQSPVGADRNPPRAKAERPQHPSKVERHPLPARVVSQPPQVGASPPQPWQVLPTVPRVEEEQATVLELTGSKCTCARPRVGYLNPQHLRTQLGWRKRGERPLVTFMIGWPEKNQPRITSPLGP